MDSEFDKRVSLEDKNRAKAENLFIDYLFGDKKLSLDWRVKELQRKFPRIAANPAIVEIYFAGQVGYPFANVQPDRAKVYCEELLEGIPKCLHPPKVTWCIDKLHQRVMLNTLWGNDMTIDVFNTSHLSILRLHLDFATKIYPQTRKRDVEKLALIEIKKQLNKEWPNIEGLDGYKTRLREREELGRNVKWLHRYLFHDYKGSNIARLYPADSKDYSPGYIDLMIRRTAKLLGISLPRGRPKKR